MTDERTPSDEQRGATDTGTRRRAGGGGCTSALLFGFGIGALGLWWTAQMFSEGGDGTIFFLVVAVAAFVTAIVVLLRNGSAEPPVA
jgi:apolipoprotein N-acyltransferase